MTRCNRCADYLFSNGHHCGQGKPITTYNAGDSECPAGRDVGSDYLVRCGGCAEYSYSGNHHCGLGKNIQTYAANDSGCPSGRPVG
jgi:hypothetical protein